MVQLTGHDMLKTKGIALIAASAPTFFLEDTPTAVLVRQVLGAIAQFEKAGLVAKLAAARKRKRVANGKCEGRKSLVETNPWILERSATGLREADLNVLSKLGNQGLEGRLEPEAFTGGEVGREDDLLDFLVGCPVYI